VSSKRRQRIDLLLVTRELAPSQEHAQRLILAGKVIVDCRRRDKPGEFVDEEADIVVKADAEWASRGAYKLLGALAAFPRLSERIQGARCLDIGASTGGFTDVLLRTGAEEVIALDVGYGLLDWRLRSDARVTVMDRTNIRHLQVDGLPWQPDFVTCDVSFISLRLFLDVIFGHLRSGGVFVALVKPQFEVPRDQVEKGGVVRNENHRQEALQAVMDLATQVGFTIQGHADSPLPGPSGNREILLLLEKPLR
jgi:23S rRNA (cytidine1920-2'-O)/16S rRNA (cytidine1409-2'-O)-methyltransferase